MDHPYDLMSRNKSRYRNSDSIPCNYLQSNSLSVYGGTQQSYQQDLPVLHGVDALFQDYRGGSQGPLEFDFGGMSSAYFSPIQIHAYLQ